MKIKTTTYWKAEKKSSKHVIRSSQRSQTQHVVSEATRKRQISLKSARVFGVSML
ncbi:unnamed protein product [Amoebophrya sp. A25]|nr:unnamed protein product [Amoebophrya sp. A25]|eukprot:GSA25T00007557001.1